ncbi:hypothetical protein DQP55_15185 [Mycolicibacterium sp. GF69]|uniref:hypothetical protein n=1 Tax=Mycolicibacterium sp. GF69 TaxID=2267251 RepID=UPI000DCD610E|nr:hypothetical protein [Mycolicibacterium sp. GF69]RAV10642.1 hypothetical protein DQP55_15185 [Mycolicibacterium sp. GF69]
MRVLRVVAAPSRVWTVLKRVLIGVVGSAGAGLIAVPGVAAAQPSEPAPPPAPNVNALAPVKLSDFAVMDGNWYAFRTPDGLTCVLQRNGGYGCSGPIPGAPNGANFVSGGPGVPQFSATTADVFASVGEVKPLPAGSRMSFQTVSCGSEGGVTTCSDSRNQSGFVLSPAGSYIINGGRDPLLERPEGTNPYFN